MTAPAPSICVRGFLLFFHGRMPILLQGQGFLPNRSSYCRRRRDKVKAAASAPYTRCPTAATAAACFSFALSRF